MPMWMLTRHYVDFGVQKLPQGVSAGGVQFGLQAWGFLDEPKHKSQKNKSSLEASLLFCITSFLALLALVAKDLSNKQMEL